VYCGSCGQKLGGVAVNGDRFVDHVVPVDGPRTGRRIAVLPAAHETVPTENGTRVKPEQRSSDATRYLCAAVHLDSRIADQVIHDVLEQDYRAAPSSPDVDLVAVVLHALAARRRQLTRDVILVVLMIAMAWSLVSLHSTAFLVSIALAWAAVLGESLVATYGVLAHDLRPGNFHPARLPRPSSSKARKRLEQIEEFGRSNVSVYSSYAPFVGHGRTVEAWSAALALRATAKREAEAFSTADIHDFVLSRMREIPVGTVEVADRIYVDGRDIRGDRRFLAGELSAPRAHVDPSLIRSLMAEPENRARPYLSFQIKGWRGQLVLSTFVRFVVTSKEIFIEVSHSLLTPVRDEFQVVDRLLPQPNPRQALLLAAKSAAMLVIYLARAPMALTRAIIGPLAAELRTARQRREILGALRFNYGAPVSPRETVSDPNFQRYFQKLDTSHYVKVLEKRLLDAIVEFLQARGIDTSEFDERKQAIENNGLYVAGNLVAGSVAVGAGARATTRSSRRPKRSG
jgi:hypothetical protein